MARKKNRQSGPSYEAESSDSGGGEGDRAQVAKNCQHITKALSLPNFKKKFKDKDKFKEPQCVECFKESVSLKSENSHESIKDSCETSLWICLQCSHIGCDRKHKSHALDHHWMPSSVDHSLAADIDSWTVWCYSCEQRLSPQSTKRLQDHIEQVKRMLEKVSSVSSVKSAVSSDSAPIKTVEIGSNVSYFKQCNNVQQNSVQPLCLQKAKGLVNLGNTCFYNALVQCLSVTPYLVTVLQNLITTGEKFILRGDPNSEEIEIPSLEGELGEIGPLTHSLLSTLQEMKNSKSDILRPDKLLNNIRSKYSQFEGNDQQDSGELLLLLLEGIRADDLKRYQRVVLEKNRMLSANPNKVEDNAKKKIKLYGQQIQEFTLGVEGVFMGKLIRMLECQTCNFISTNIENFLDLNLPVAEEKPLPPVRKKDPLLEANIKSPKNNSRNKRRKRFEAKSKKQDYFTPTIVEENGNSINGNKSEPSDADVEDNGDQDTGNGKEESGYSSDRPNTGSDRTSPGDCQTGEELSNSPTGSPVTPDDSAWAFENNGPANTNNNSLESVELTVPTLEELTSIHEPELSTSGQCDAVENFSCEPKDCSTLSNNEKDSSTLDMNEKDSSSVNDITDRLHSLNVSQSEYDSLFADVTKESREKPKSDPASWSQTLVPRPHTAEGDCSIISCLNQFTTIELLTGKLVCNVCTKRQNKGKEGKPVSTNCTMQYLISLPPPVLVLQLKRLSQENGRIKKLHRFVHFPLELDLAPFCSTQCKDLPSIGKDQSEVKYSLYGVVEHQGSEKSGHYVAYIKIRPGIPLDDRRWTFLSQNRDFVYPSPSQLADAANGSDETTNNLEGNWYLLSDSRVTSTTEAKVLKATAYLLFYERFL